MKKTYQMTITAIALACIASAVQAQSGNFVGPAVGLSVSAIASKLDRDPAWTSDMTGNAAGVGLVGSWGLEVAPQWVVTFGATLSLNKPELYSETSSGTTSTATSKQRYSLSIAPGYRLGDAGLLYGKVGYHAMVMNYNSNSGTDMDKTHQGYGVGFGYARAITKNIELRGEFESIVFSGENTASTTKITPKQNNLNLSLLYKF